MNITYQLTGNEYQEAVAFHHKKGRRSLMVSIYAGLATFFILVGTDFSNSREVIMNIFVAFFSISFYILFVRILTDIKAKKIYDKSPILSKEITLHVSGKGIKQDKKTASELLPWSLFTQWKESGKFYLLYAGKHHFNVIPKRVLNEREQEELEAHFRKHLRKSV